MKASMDGLDVLWMRMTLIGCVWCEMNRPNLLVFVRSLNASLGHQIADAFLQIIDSIGHIVDAGNHLVGHRLEFVLDILQ